MRYYLALFLMLAACAWGAEIVENHADDVITYFVMVDRTTGLRDTGVTIANLEMYYIEDQAAESADVFVGAHGAVTDAHTDGECIHVGHGVYRIDWTDDAFDGGVGKRVQLTVVDGDAGAKTETLVILLSPPSNVTQLDGSDIQQTTGHIHAYDDAGAALCPSGEPLTAQETEDEAIDALESFKLDELNAEAVTTSLATAVNDNSILGYILASANVSNYVRTTDSLEDLGENIADIETDTAAYDTDAEHATAIWNAATNAYGGAGTYGQAIEDILADTSAFDTSAEWLALLAAVNTDATSATHATTYVTLEAGKASNDAYNGQTISVTDATDGLAETRRIEDYTSGRKVTFDRALSFTPVQDDVIRIYDMPYNIVAAIAGGTANTYIVTDTGAVGGTGIADVAVWLTIDSAGARLITSGLTDDNGEVVFYLDSGITYYVWMSKSGYSFSDNGEAWVAD